MATIYSKEFYKKAGYPTNITLPDGVTEIGNSVFSGCTAITKVNLPEGLTWSKVKVKFAGSPWGECNPAETK